MYKYEGTRGGDGLAEADNIGVGGREEVGFTCSSSRDGQWMIKWG